jgi:heat shock protein HslJ
MQRVPRPGQLCRVVFAAAGLIVAVACGGGDTSGPSNLDDGTSGSTIALVDEVNDTPSDDESAPTEEGEDRRAELVGRWEVANYALPDGGGLTNVVGDGPVFIEFDANGMLSYSTGCNEGTTGYRASGVYVVPKSALDDTPRGQPITIGPSFEQTEIACDGFLGDQDRDLPSNLGAATRFVLDGDRLALHDEFLLIEATKTR